MKVGVLALQGAFREHIYALEALDVGAVAVRKPEQLDACAGLIIPGGESTAISKLMATYGFYKPIERRANEGMALWGTCAGSILIARHVIDGAPGQSSLALMNVSVRRNAYGRQRDSFEADIDFAGISGGAYRGVFIRAPWIESVGEGVEVLARHEGHIVAARQSTMLSTTFHPELTGDPRVHRYFVERIIRS